MAAYRLAWRNERPSRICRHHFLTTLRLTRLALWMYLHDRGGMRRDAWAAAMELLRGVWRLLGPPRRRYLLFERAGSHDLGDEYDLPRVRQVKVREDRQDVLPTTNAPKAEVMPPRAGGAAQHRRCRRGAHSGVVRCAWRRAALAAAPASSKGLRNRAIQRAG